MIRTKLTAEQLEVLRQRYAELSLVSRDEWNLADLAEKFGVSTHRLKALASAMGLTTRYRLRRILQSGAVYGEWRVLQRSAEQGKRCAYHDCVCLICGFQKRIQAIHLLTGSAAQCSCKRTGRDKFVEPPSLNGERYIPLTRGKVAIVDAADYEWLKQWRWTATFNKVARRWYAYRSYRLNGKTLSTPMHRQIMGLERGDPRQIDHVNIEATLDNRKANLRICTRAQNTAHRKMVSNNKSGYRGVFYLKNSRKWKASIGVNWQVIELGSYPTKEEAAAAYAAAAAKYHGEFAGELTHAPA